MKRALQSYDDLDVENENGEEGEIIEDELEENTREDCLSDQEEFGLKAVLPVGKFNANFKEGDTPASGEEYLCAVRCERKKIPLIIKSDENAESTGIEIQKLFKQNVQVVEIDGEWAEKYWKCYKESEKTFLQSISEYQIDETDFENFTKMSSIDLYKKFYKEIEIVPSINFLAYLKSNQDFTEKLIFYHKNWLDPCTLTPIESEQNERIATWIQALIMCLDDRLTSPQISILRQLVQILNSNHQEFKEIILVVSYKYGQKDLIKINGK